MSYIEKNIVKFQKKNNHTGGVPEAGSTLEPAVAGAAAAGHIDQPGQEQLVPAAGKAAGAAGAVAEEEPVRVPAAGTGMPEANQTKRKKDISESMTQKTYIKTCPRLQYRGRHNGRMQGDLPVEESPE